MLFVLKGSPSLELLTLRYKCHFEIKKPRSARITIKFSPWFSCVCYAGIASPSLHLTTTFLCTTKITFYYYIEERLAKKFGAEFPTNQRQKQKQL